MRTPSTFFVIAISLTAVLVAVSALMLLNRVSQNPKTVQAKLKLQPGETRTDFKILTFANLMIGLTLLGYGFAGYKQLDNVLIGLEILLVLFTVPVAVVFYKIAGRTK